MDVGASLRPHPAPEGFYPWIAAGASRGCAHALFKPYLPQPPVADVAAILIAVPFTADSFTADSFTADAFPKGPLTGRSFAGARCPRYFRASSAFGLRPRLPSSAAGSSITCREDFKRLLCALYLRAFLVLHHFWHYGSRATGGTVTTPSSIQTHAILQRNHTGRNHTGRNHTCAGRIGMLAVRSTGSAPQVQHHRA